MAMGNKIVGTAIGVVMIIIMAVVVEGILANVTFTGTISTLIKGYIVPFMVLGALVTAAFIAVRGR